MVTSHIYLKNWPKQPIIKFGVSAIKKGGGAAPKHHPIGLKFLGESFYSDVIPKTLTEHKLSKLLFFWDILLHILHCAFGVMLFVPTSGNCGKKVTTL